MKILRLVYIREFVLVHILSQSSMIEGMVHGHLPNVATSDIQDKCRIVLGPTELPSFYYTSCTSIPIIDLSGVHAPHDLTDLTLSA